MTTHTTENGTELMSTTLGDLLDSIYPKGYHGIVVEEVKTIEAAAAPADPTYSE